MHDNKYLAHIKQNESGGWKAQTWSEHSAGVAKLGGDFASKFGNGDWADFGGWYHDTGKLVGSWQNYLRDKTGYDADRFPEKSDRGNHSALGARLIYEKAISPINRHILSYLILGHHAGLPDFSYDEGKGDSLTERLFSRGRENRDEIREELSAQLNKLLKDGDSAAADMVKGLLNKPYPASIPVFIANGEKSADPMALWIRMLFSCLVDADFLDTERFMDKERFLERARYASLGELKKEFDLYMDKKTAEAQKRKLKINELRARILASCRVKAKLKPGVFTLSVPTGAGKTLASMAFALEHALHHGKDRIIVAIPYTSIIEQTASVFKYGTDDPEKIKHGAKLFGEQNVVEHHSSFDTEKGDDAETSLRNKLACENWDAPIIVTTNVQLFESLAGARPSRCRKLHNIVNSVIILDEAQLLPPEYLKSIIETLKHLVKHFNVTVLLCTATQPALTGSIGAGKDGKPAFEGLENSVELADEDRDEMFSQFKRVNFYLPGDRKYNSWQELSETLCRHESVLCVVNTRNSARDLLGQMPDGTSHLSGLMCAEDRSDVIAGVKEKLAKGESVRLISTQLIEAGVDIDFPVVYRAYAGLDSIVQAAGRCNREGRQKQGGKVFVFNAPVGSPIGFLRKAEDTARLILNTADSFTLSDELCRKYFELYYRAADNLDKAQFHERMLTGAKQGEFQFRTYAQNYRMIDDKNQKAIIVPYESSRSAKSSRPLIERLKSGRAADHSLFRKLQRFTVNVPENIFFEMSKKGYIEPMEECGYGILLDELYKPGAGVILEDPKWEAVVI